MRTHTHTTQIISNLERRRMSKQHRYRHIRPQLCSKQTTSKECQALHVSKCEERAWWVHNVMRVTLQGLPQTIGSNAKRYHRNETTNHATTFSLAFKIMIPAYFGAPVLPTTSVLTLSRRHPQSWTGLQARAPSTGTCKLHGATWNTNICPVSLTTKQTSHTCQTIHEPIQTCPIIMDAWKQLFGSQMIKKTPYQC